MSAPFMQLYVADYLGDTRHLTTEQHGAYLLLLMTLWRSGGRLASDPRTLARVTGCTPSRWAKIKAEVLEFFEEDAGQILNRRLMFELEKASEKSIKRADAGARGGAAKALKNNKPTEAIATVLPKHSSEPEPEKETSEAKASSPKKRGSKFVPEAWSPTPADVAMAGVLGFTPGDMERELSRFRRHEFPRPYTDWSKTFQNWLDRAAERRPRQDNDRPHHDAKFDARHENYRAAGRGADLAARLQDFS